ncbi:hypothetical protein DPMN_068561 [Dreissena polymorpha]|uniref:Uncharacterized protein n=1 Tax=Dreissena polymorpha TaxID=45954 RepID=A0A9D3Z1U6_DREPO|nr:hypothetical protein DPMN_068561 [Dreissena polymorpha]
MIKEWPIVTNRRRNVVESSYAQYDCDRVLMIWELYALATLIFEHAQNKRSWIVAKKKQEEKDKSRNEDHNLPNCSI